jgi:ubiquinone/menaquinone biosynthesis C-methylase UbiE
MLATLVVVAAIATVWTVLRRAGHGKPYPVWLSWLLDNAVTNKLSRTTMLIERAGVTDGMRVLDAGCGPGRLSIPLARRVGIGGIVVAVDVQEGMLERVRRRAADQQLNNVRTLRSALDANVEVPELLAANIDRAFLVTVLGEVPDPEGAMRTLYLALKPGGVLSVTEMIIDPDYQTRRQVRTLGQRVGFEVEESFGTPLAFTQNLRKPR